MSRLRVLATPYWAISTSLAFLGVALARVIGPALAEDAARRYTAAGGHVLVGLGLFVICLGVRNRLRAAKTPGRGGPRGNGGGPGRRCRRRGAPCCSRAG